MGISNWILIWTAIMPLAVIIYYFFRKKYKDQRVSSTMFWNETMKELRASPYLKKLQHHLLFYLQLAALILCVAALLGPFIKSDTLAGNEFIFVVDRSATMLAGSPSHFERQQGLMQDLAEQAGGKPVTIVAAGAVPEVLLRNEKNTGKVKQAIDNLTVTYSNAEMEKTLLFAETLIENESAVIHVFTDSLDRRLLANKAEHAYVVHGIAEILNNASIRQFGLAETEDGMRAIVQVVNDSEEPLVGRVELSDGEIAESLAIELKAGEELLVPFEDLPAADLWQASLQIEDDYAADNKAFTFVQQPAGSVTIDSSLHKLVNNGFSSLDIEVNSADPGQLSGNSAAPIVTNQTELLENDAPILLIGRNDEEKNEVSGQIQTAEHPLFTYAPMDEVYVLELYPPFDGYETIASINDDPLIQLSPAGDIVVLTDIQSTDWPLSPSFPLFLWSAAGELSGSGNYLGTFQPEEQRSVALASETGEWEIFDGEDYLYSYIEGAGPFIAPEEPGIYKAIASDESKTFIVSLSNEEKEIQAGSDYAIGEAAASEETVRHSLVPWLIGLVLLLICAEWEVYRRGTSSR